MEEMTETNVAMEDSAEETECMRNAEAFATEDMGEADTKQPEETEAPGGEPVAPVTEALPTPHADLSVRMGRQIVKTARLEREVQRLQRMVRAYQRADELRTLQAHDPQADLTDLAVLGEDYACLRRAGVSATVAYEAVKHQRTNGEVPPDLGALGNDRAQEKEFYTPDEVDRLTSRELDDPKIMERVMRSMTKWKK